MYRTNSEIVSETSESETRKQSMQVHDKVITFRPAIDQFDNHLSDSGFKSNCYPDKRKSNEKLGKRKIEVPHMLSFVGGAFTVQLYKNAVIFICVGFFQMIFNNLIDKIYRKHCQRRTLRSCAYR